MNPAMRDLFLGGEDEEEQDLTDSAAHAAQPRAQPTDLHQPGARHAYLNVDVRSNPDGSATAWHYTNDRDGDGRPDRRGTGWDELLVSWDEAFASVAEARRAIGTSRVEPSGRIVTVFRDGVRDGTAR